MSRKISEFENHLIDLVHFLAYGRANEKGLSIREVKKFLMTSVKETGRTPMEALEDGGEFLNQLKVFLNEIEEN